MIAKGHTFANDSDTECLIHGYEEYGTRITWKIKRNVSFVISGILIKKLMFGARGHFGIKPFYYSLFNDNFIFSSETKAILEFRDLKKLMYSWTVFKFSVFCSSWNLFFKGIYRLPAGWSTLYLKMETWSPKIFWSNDGTGRKWRFRKTVGEIENVVKDTINAHMIADVEVGSLLSSGVDSSYVVSGISGKKTFTVGFLDKAVNIMKSDMPKVL